MAAANHFIGGGGGVSVHVLHSNRANSSTSTRHQMNEEFILASIVAILPS